MDENIITSATKTPEVTNFWQAMVMGGKGSWTIVLCICVFLFLANYG